MGYTHYKWQQTINNISIENAVLIQHILNNKEISEYSHWVQDTVSVTNKSKFASITPALAITNAVKYVGAKTYQWEIPAEEKLLQLSSRNPNATYYPKPILVYYSGEGEIDPDKLKLCFKMEIYPHFPLSRQIIFVDAQKGSILGHRQLIQASDVIATAQTAYSSSQSITTDQISSNQYRLREAGRGNGIGTVNMSGQGNNFSSATEFYNSSTSWNLTGIYQYALDAHWGQEMTYDFYKNNFNRNSIDNAGYALVGYVHTDLTTVGLSSNNNAFWNGSKILYGDGGSGSGATPSTALDIVGHEITHGLTQYTAGLAPNKESGALNESFSDMMGTSIEFFAKPGSANWTYGENTGAVIRNLANPKALFMPDTYGGTNWIDVSNCNPTANNDECSVHNNCTVGDFWFYLLTVGKSGTNDLNNSYNVQGIGIIKAQAIAFRTLTIHLTSTSNYADCRTQSIIAATELYGVNSTEVISVTNAWYAVGVGAASTSVITGQPYICNSNIYTIYNLPTNATVVWSIPGSTGPVLTLSQNTPSTNQLTITNQHYYTVSTTLTANVSIGSNPSITYTLPIANDNSITISAPYTQDACTYYNVSHPSQSGTATSSQSTFVNMGCGVRVTLNLPSNKTVTLAPNQGTPIYWYYSSGILYFALPYGSGGIPFVFNIGPTTNDGSCTASLTFFAYSNNQNAYAYTVAPNPAAADNLTVLVSNSSTNNSADAIQSNNNNSLLTKDNKVINKNDFQFDVKIYDVINNKIVLTGKSNRGEMVGKFNISSLKPGNYFVQITDAYQTQVIKFLKN